MTKYQIIFALSTLFIILVAVIFKDRVKAAFMGLKLSTDNRTKKNIATVKGHFNEVEQSVTNKSGDLSQKNEARVEGEGNKLKQL
jgi:hypothetical protein